MAEAAAGKKPSISHMFSRLLDVLKEIFTPVLTALTAAGILQGITILLHTFGVIHPNTANYGLLTTMSSCVFYYLPIMLAYTSASTFKTNRFIAMSAAFFLVYPDNVQQLETWAGQAKFFGLVLPPGHYPSSVIPIILVVWVQSYIERFFNKIIPEIVKGIFVPTFTLLVTDYLAITIVAPIGASIGNGLSGILLWLSDKVPWLTPMLLGGFGIFVVMTGAHYSLIPVATQTISSVGHDTFFIPGMLASNLALAGAAFAIWARTRQSKYKGYCLSAGVTSSLGVSQPALYGVALYYRQALVGAIVGGLAGGLYAGIFHVYAYAFVNPGLAALPAFINPDGTWGNFINSLIVIVISFVVAFLITFLPKFQELDEEVVDEIAASDEEEDDKKEEGAQAAEQK